MSYVEEAPGMVRAGSVADWPKRTQLSFVCDEWNMKRVGLKYCGGCNPVYDREAYVARIRSVAMDLIEWVSYDEGGFTTLLLVNGCERSCIQEEMSKDAVGRIVSIKDDGKSPEQIVSLLMKQGEKP